MTGPDAIEIHDAGGALERIEAWLRDRGFFVPGGEALVADLYLGYGLSASLRRRHTPAPPEPCPLPLAACSVRPEEYVVGYDNALHEPLSFGPWLQTWTPGDYAGAVARVREAIARGDVYQVNLVQHLAADFGAGQARSPPASRA